MATPLHEDEIRIDTALVRGLIDQQFPGHASQPLSRLETTGSSNALFRLGSALLVRLPRQPGGGTTIDKEARWLPRLGPSLPVAVPEIVAVGAPGLGYPERWSIVRWLEGELPLAPDPAHGARPDRHELARELAALVVALRALEVPPVAVGDPALRWYRGEPLSTRDTDTRCFVEACRAIDGLDLDLDAVLSLWGTVMAQPGVEEHVAPRWYHGDLAAENLLVRDQHLHAVLDFGGLAVGDPTVDLVIAWEVLGPADRETFRTEVGADDAEWLRAMGWALSLAVMTFPYYWRTMPDRCLSRLAMARAVLSEAAFG